MRQKLDKGHTDYRCHEAYRRTRSLLLEVCRAQSRRDRRGAHDEVLSRLRRAAARAAVCLTGLGASLSQRCLERSLQVLDEAGSLIRGAAAEGQIGLTDASTLARTHREARIAVSAALSSAPCLLTGSVPPSSHPSRGVGARD